LGARFGQEERQMTPVPAIRVKIRGVLSWALAISLLGGLMMLWLLWVRWLVYGCGGMCPDLWPFVPLW